MIPISETTRSIKPTTAYAAFRVVTMAGDTHFPRCDRELRATDVDIYRGEIWLRCRNCHSDVLTIERE